MNELLERLRYLLPGTPDACLHIVVDVVARALHRNGGRPAKMAENGVFARSPDRPKTTLVVPSDLRSGSSLPLFRNSEQSGSESDLGNAQCDEGTTALSVVVKKPKGANGLLAWVSGLFVEAWSAEYGEKYLPSQADLSMLGRTLRTFGSAAEIEAFPWAAVFDSYLADKSRWVAEEHRHSMKQFCTGGVNKYRVAAGTEGFGDKEIRGMQAADAFVRGGR